MEEDGLSSGFPTLSPTPTSAALLLSQHDQYLQSQQNQLQAQLQQHLLLPPSQQSQQQSLQSSQSLQPPPPPQLKHQSSSSSSVLPSSASSASASASASASTSAPEHVQRGRSIRQPSTNRRRTKLSSQERAKILEVRRQRACLRCKMLKIQCSKENPCKPCLSSAVRGYERKVLSFCYCVRTRFVDVDIFQRSAYQPVIDNIDLECY